MVWKPHGTPALLLLALLAAALADTTTAKVRPARGRLYVHVPAKALRIHTKPGIPRYPSKDLT